MQKRVESVSFIEKLFRAIPYLRRPYFQRDEALAALEATRTELEVTKVKAIYRNLSISSATRRLFDQPNWFLLADEDARQDKSIGDLRAYVAKAVRKDCASLEIGPAFSPILPRRAGYAVTTVDHADREALVAKYTGHGLDVSKIDFVDVVWTEGSLVEATSHRKFDAIVVAHVIEHAPDLIQFLKDCTDSLSDSGVIYLLVPDKRYSFDFWQPRSDVAKVLGDHRIKRTRHSFESFYRHISASVRNGEQIAWDQSGISKLTFMHGDPFYSREYAEQNITSASYQDEHANYFTPVSFAIILDELRYLREVDLELVVLTRSRGCEFLAVLRKTGPAANMSMDGFLKRKMDSYRLLLLEDQEQITSASGVLVS
jgi:2-polyprenyl-3-methyl-5-hydroxy-6-metoxy-1,4-benzoquinol methylase